MAIGKLLMSFHPPTNTQKAPRLSFPPALLPSIFRFPSTFSERARANQQKAMRNRAAQLMYACAIL